MKCLLKSLIFAATFISLSTSSFAYSENWEIDSFKSDITINTNGSVEISETIETDFSNESHRGILRSIPYHKEEIHFISGTNDKNESWDIETYKDNGFFNIELRNQENLLMSGTETFIVKYKADKIIKFFDEEPYPHDEFYWNVNGTDWPVNTEKVWGTITLSKTLSKEEIKLECFTGTYGLEEKNCEFSKLKDQNNTISFKTTSPLSQYENLTIVVGMPPRTIPPPSLFERILDSLVNNWGIPFAFLTLIIMLTLWNKYGRDDQSVSNTIMPYYRPPEGMLPTETGILIDEKLDPKDITATIIDFAIKKYIRINELEKDFELELLKPYETNKEFEKLIMEAIFENNKTGEKIRISKLKDKFHKSYKKIQKTILEQMIKDDYFPHKPSTIRGIYSAIGGVMIMGMIQLGTIFSITTVIGVIISGLIIIGIGYKMPRKTHKGTVTFYKLKGLYEYINTAEKDRMKFQEKNNIMFEKLLPFAMSFGIIEKWSKAFDGIIKTPPDWYNPSKPWGNGFNMIYFGRTLNKIGTKLTSNIAHKSGSKSGGAWSGGSGFGGGGFSGGGFGGGGGRGL